MKKNISYYMYATALTAMMGLTGCSSGDDVTPEPETKEQTRYIVTAVVDKANFLLAADDLTKGSLTTVNNGLVTDASTNWLTLNNKFFGLTYRQGNPAVVASYALDEKGMPMSTNLKYDVKRYATYGTYGNLVVTGAPFDYTSMKDDEGNIAKGVEITTIDTGTGNTSTQEILGENLLGNGEYVTFAGFLQDGNRMLTAVIPMGLSVYGSHAENGKYVKYPELVAKEDGGEKSSSYKKGELQWTQYPNEAWIAIYNGTDITQKPKLISTNRISYPAGRFKSQYYQMVWKDDNGDIYVFSPNFSRIYFTGEQQKSTLPAGVVRIKKGTEQFDDSYYVNLEEQANGHSFIRVWPAGGSNFLLQMFSQGMGKNAEGATDLAIFNATTKKLTYVSGLPDAGTYSFVSTPTPLYDNGKIYFPVNSNVGKPAVYVIDVAKATATRGIEVDATTISAISKLTNK